MSTILELYLVISMVSGAFLVTGVISDKELTLHELIFGIIILPGVITFLSIYGIGLAIQKIFSFAKYTNKTIFKWE